MIYQLPNGRIIEISTEMYFELTDEEIMDLNGLSSTQTSDITNPFYKSVIKKGTKDAKEEEKPEIWDVEEREPDLDEVKTIEKMDDKYFHRDDV